MLIDKIGDAVIVMLTVVLFGVVATSVVQEVFRIGEIAY